MEIKNGLVIIGCGKMGSALLEGWLKSGVLPQDIWIIEPKPTARLLALEGQGLHLNTGFPPQPALCLLAVKPQYMQQALPQLRELNGGLTVYLSIAAGISLAALEDSLGEAAIIRAMPNTPAAIGLGITALIGNARTSSAQMDLARSLLQSIGETVLLQNEAQMDAVTGLSGSGPAYVFYMIEALTEAGIEQGLPEALAGQLALATVAGAGQLAVRSSESVAQLRINVTSPEGTTEAGLRVLMDADTGLKPLLGKTVAAAVIRARALGEH